MAYAGTSTDDFALYLNNSNIDVQRATFIIGLAETMCQTVVNPLPDGAEVVVLDVAERAYANPVGVSGAMPGLYAEGEGPYNDVTPGHTGGGLWLTDNNRQMLRELGGGTSAFAVDMTPAGAGQNLPFWDNGNIWGSW